MREFLEQSHYDEPSLCARLGTAGPQEFMDVDPKPDSPAAIIDALDVLIRLFLTGEQVQGIEKWISPAPLKVMQDLGLLCSPEPGLCCGSVALYPCHGLYITSDHWNLPKGLPPRSDDVVYPAISVQTLFFLNQLPPLPCEAFLEICAGTGTAALIAATKYARHSWAMDLTARSTQLGEFNRRLNAVENLTVARSDLYEAVAGLTFDRIVAHPPYMPVLRRGPIFAAGGELGEQVTSRIVRESPRHLRPGGRLYCVTTGVDCADQPFEERARGWLGEWESEFDVLMIVNRCFQTDHMAMHAALLDGGMNDLKLWKALFQERRVEQMVHGTLVVQRKSGARPPFTARRDRRSDGGAADIEWLLAWEAAAAGPSIRSFLLSARPVASPELRLQVTHRVQGGELAPVAFTLATSHPFVVDCKIEPWTAYLLGRCDGTATALEHFAYCKEVGLLHPETPVEEFADLLRVLVSGGYLEVEGFASPRRKTTCP